jgi:subtilisin-like proprotein convertase family protein
VTVSNTAGPFRVNTPASLVFWRSGEIRQLRWDVANTDKPPFNCDQVNILLSTDGGKTFGIKIAEKVPNNGYYCFTVPDTLITAARIKIEGVGQIFYDINNSNFQIRPPFEPAFSVCGGETAATVCLPDVYSTSLVTSAVMGFDSPITFSASGLPSGASAVFSPNPAMPGQPVTVQVYLPDTLQRAAYNVRFKAKSGGDSTLISTRLTVIPNDYSNLSLRTPVYGTPNLAQSQRLRWQKVPVATTYDVQIATSPAFEPATVVLEKSGLTADSLQTPLLEKGGIYYWRVRGRNECGAGSWTDVGVFGTRAEACSVLTANDLPKNISSNGTPTVESAITVNANAVISDLNVKRMEGNHAFFRDLKVSLTGPDGKTAALFASKCGNYNGKFAFGFDDEAATEIACPPNAQGLVFKPVQPLSVFKGTNSLGSWRLKVEDGTIGSGGALAAFQLEICASIALNPPFLVVNNPLALPGGSNAPITTSLLEVQDADNTPDQITYTLVTVPVKGSLRRADGGVLTVGSQFTQADLNKSDIRYFDDNTGPDAFRFVAADAQGSFLADTFFLRPTSIGTGTRDFEDPLRPAFALWPNPAAHYLLVRFAHPLSADLPLRLLDATGRVLRTARLTAGAQQWEGSIAELPDGLYSVQCGATVRKLVVAHE